MDECVAVAEAEAVAVAVTEAVAEADQFIHDRSMHDPSSLLIGKFSQLTMFRIHTVENLAYSYS